MQRLHQNIEKCNPHFNENGFSIFDFMRETNNAWNIYEKLVVIPVIEEMCTRESANSIERNLNYIGIIA
jgi:hypothetical protein